MAEQVTLATRPRTGSGKGEARALRREGRVPAIAYGVGIDPTPLSVDALDLYHALHTDAGDNAVLRLAVEGGTHLALAREVQRHPVRRDVLHLDFVTVSRTQKVQAVVPVVLEGEAPGVAEGGVAEQAAFTLNVEALALEVPDQLVLDVSDLGVGDVKRASDVALPAGVELLDDPESPVVSIVVPALDVPETEGEQERDAGEREAEGATADEAEAAAAAE
jgi:large subunit ribosomal protein L25